MNWAAVVFVGFLSLILAYLEIQIEGREGHAKNLPCWRRNIKTFTKIFGCEVTGYHSALYLFLFTSFHFIFCFIPWRLSTELFVLGLVIELLLLEDFFWFLLNPAFGIEKFKKEFIPWHKKWIGPIPTVYYYALGVIAFLFITISFLS